MDGDTVKDATRRLLHIAGVAAILAAPLPLALPVQAASDTPPTPADVFIPPSPKTLEPQDIVVVQGAKPGQAKLKTRDGGPLALLAVTTTADGRVNVVSPGTDFTRPSTWRELGFGDICWRSPLTGEDTYVLPASTLPFVGPPGDWQYSNVIVWSERGPRVFNKPAPGEYVSADGAPIEYVISCVSAGTKDRVFRADPVPAPIATADPLPLASADPAPLPSASPTASPSPTTAEDSSTTTTDNDRKVTICHRTNSTSSPYVLETVSVNSIDNSGHLQHTGPIYPQVDADGNWGDVIPPYEGNNAGVNWPAGEGLLDNGCQVVSPPEPPIIPIDPPELPVKPEPPIIEVTPPVRPEPPIATLPPSPSATATTPIATIEPSPTASGTPSPSATPTSPSTPGATSTPEPPTTPAPPTQSPTASPASSPGSSLQPTPVATGEAGTVIDDLNRYCETKDEADLPASLQEVRTSLIVTNGVSALTLDRPLPKLYCAARPLPGTVAEDAELADTGMDLRTAGAASLLLIGLGLLLAPAIARRR